MFSERLLLRKMFWIFAPHTERWPIARPARTKRNDPWLLLYATKGHFCSLLISNIFCYPLFHHTPFCSIATTPETLSTFFSTENTTCFLFALLLQKVWDSDFPKACHQRRSELNSWSLLLVRLTNLFLCVTPPCFFTLSTCSNRLVLGLPFWKRSCEV